MFPFDKLKEYSSSARYRILLFTSAPILITVIALIGITLYWAFSYTWKNTLHDVSTRLQIAQSSFGLLKSTQEASLNAISQSYRFQELLRKKANTKYINDFLKTLTTSYAVDYIQYYPLTDSSRSPQNVTYGSYFSVLSSDDLNQIDRKLSQQSKIRLAKSGATLSRGLVLKTVSAVVDVNFNVVGYLDAGVLINNSSEIVDKLRDLIYPPTHINHSSLGTVTLFLDKYRVSTNVPLINANKFRSSGTRALGTEVSVQVATVVLKEDKVWLGLANVVDGWYVAGYQSIKDEYGNNIGIVYTGYSIWSFLQEYIISISILLSLALLLLILATYFVLKESSALFLPLEKMGEVIKRIKLGETTRIGDLGLHENHELSVLARQFDFMLDNLEEQNKEIKGLVSDLELKVAERTEKLEIKTKQLEHHIDLLNQTKNKLVSQEKFAALGVLTAGIAHEINNPVAVILGNVELIKIAVNRGSLDIGDEIRTIFEQIDRIKSINHSLLQYSKQPSAALNQPIYQDINSIIEESITLTNTGCAKKNIIFELRCNARTTTVVDKHQMLQVLINLELNAIDAMQGTGKIILSTDDDINTDGSVNGVIVNITDEGCGIPDDQLGKIFDPFFSMKKDGTGLGLAVSNSIINQIGGEITVSSVQGKGTTFTIYLPVNVSLSNG
ncbi:two-component sensor histidine kinase [Vibrio viridaestus]|uniref:histidine kinase n=2 Tax=Vibrio viridaestus TaxID=2487322 RepID=A0A3N9TH19_9VIBR|nr:two-component sensor histidine kinase [Vibrio viridaestus]